MYLGEIVTTLMLTRNLPGYMVVLPATSHTLDDITIPLAIIERIFPISFCMANSYPLSRTVMGRAQGLGRSFQRRETQKRPDFHCNMIRRSSISAALKLSASKWE